MFADYLEERAEGAEGPDPRKRGRGHTPQIKIVPLAAASTSTGPNSVEEQEALANNQKMEQKVTE